MIKKDLSLYLVDPAGQRYNLPIYEDVRYSQVLSEEEIENKTLHNPLDLYKGGFTTKYNPGNFQFTIPVMDSTTARALFSLYFEHNPEPFTLFFSENSKLIKLNTCVVTGVTFNFVKDAIITATISGDYSISVDNEPLYGTVQPTLGSLYTYIEGIAITLDNEPIDRITGFSLEMANEVNWVENKYIHSTTPPYPTEFYCEEKRLSGNFTQNEDLNIPSYYDSVPLLVQIKCNGNIFLEFDFGSVISTTRPQLDSVIKRGFDFRINSNENNSVKYKGVNIL